MTPAETEFIIDRMREDVKLLESKVKELEEQDKRRLRSAVVALGAIVLSMGTYIWTVMVGNAR